MRTVQVKYKNVRKNMKAGDVIAFGGKGAFSDIIKLGTDSNVSHVGVILQTKVTHNSDSRFFNNIIESTSMENKGGVNISRLSDVINNYDGDVWWLPLDEDIRESLNVNEFFDFLLGQNGKQYDMHQAIKSALDVMEGTWLEFIDTNKEDYEKFFCSELVAAGLEVGGVLKDINCSEMTPMDVCNFPIYQDVCFQLKGEYKNLGIEINFNDS